MRLITLLSPSYARTACGAALLLALGACNDGTAGAPAAAAGAPAAPASTAAATGAGSAKTYHLVTQLRPENVQKYFARTRAVYDICVASARMLKVAAKPFPVIPEDFVAGRTIYASDGKRTYFKEVEFTIDEGGFEPEKGCELKIASHWRGELVRDGKARSADKSADGAYVLGEEEPANNDKVSQSYLDMFTTPKVVNGIKLKCSADAICIVDPAVALIAEGKRPVQAASRIDDARLHGTPMVREPVSLSVGKPLDPALFSLEDTK